MAPYRFAVLGDPIEHSKSPVLHAAMLELAGLDGDYSRVRADAAVLAEAVADLRRGEWDGLNVTMPLKSEAARRADSLAPDALSSGSVNTLVRSGDEVIGHSTDHAAFRELLASDRFRTLETTLVLGSGGSAAAAMSAIPRHHNSYVSARSPERAEQAGARHGAAVVAWGAAVAGALIINATPLGMGGETLPEGVLRAAAGLIDLPYATGQTPAVETATALGLPVADGHEFLLRQAMHSFRLWTGVDIDFDALSDVIRKI